MAHEMEYLEVAQKIERRGIKNVLPAMDNQCFYYSNA
jgi:hypothetical protein